MGLIGPITLQVRDGAGVTLASATEADAPDVLAFRNLLSTTADFIATAPGEVDPDVELQKKQIREFREKPGGLLALARYEGSVVGAMSMMVPVKRRLAHAVEFGMGMSPAWRGRGLGTLFMERMVAWARENPAILKVTLGVIPDNAHALRLYTKFGFVEEARQARQFRTDDGRLYDHVMMGLWVGEGKEPLRSH
ncbi:MAG: GNAT family N-acetyltransferase [Phycisphaerales bacterium]|nr:GNAT family N-acetyltransferase [Phycisphaerales bacterium]